MNIVKQHNDPNNKIKKGEEFNMENWNVNFAIGTPVMLFMNGGLVVSTITRSKAELIDRKAVVYLVGFKNPVNIITIKPLIHEKRLCFH